LEIKNDFSKCKGEKIKTENSQNKIEQFTYFFYTLALILVKTFDMAMKVTPGITINSAGRLKNIGLQQTPLLRQT